MKRFLILFLSLGCNFIFAETNYNKTLENFAETLILKKYNTGEKKESNEKIYIKAHPLSKIKTYTMCNSQLKGHIVGEKLKPHTTVKITCSDPTSWSIYIRVKIKKLLPVIVASQSLSKNQILNKNNIKILYLEKSRIKSGAFSLPSSLYGSRLKRNITKNRTIKNRDICVVCKNDKVNIYAKNGGLSIKTSGIALSDANIGSTVRVKNTQTQRVVVGVVRGLKNVQIAF